MKIAMTAGTLMPAKRPTFYFIGVTTEKSSMMKLFPEWSEYLNLDAEIAGINMAIHDKEENYVKVAGFLKNELLSLGGLVTTHKIDMYKACRKTKIFDYFDEYAEKLQEISCISKLEGRFEGHAKDPISCSLAMKSFIPENYFKNKKTEVFIMGAGGSAVAICHFLMKNGGSTSNLPEKIIVSNRSQPRLDNLLRLLSQIRNVPVETYCVGENPENNDKILARLSEGAVVINATGKGKDSPGSPLTDNAPWPSNAIAWELNYRGELDFYHQALSRQQEKNLTVENGWFYFIHGWTQVIFQVFHISVTQTQFKKLVNIANNIRK